jgi:O-antigen/teichoic acid export membrane protein
MVVLTLVASLLNYGSNILFSRVLNPAGYGELTALFALSVVVAVPATAGQTIIAERIAVYTAANRPEQIRLLVRQALAHVSVIAAVVGLVYLAATPLVVSALNLRHAGVAIALTPVLMLAFVQPVALGVLQGLERFTAYGVMLLAIALSRVLFGLPWAALEHGAGGAIGGQAVGMFLVLIAAGLAMRRFVAARGSGAATAGLKRIPNARALAAGAAFIGFAILTNLDIILAKIYLSPHAAGAYAALSTIGKIILFLPAAIAVVMVPNAAKARLDTGSSSRVLRVSALMVGGVSLVAAVPAVAEPRFLIKLMFGAKYLSAVSGVLPMVIAGAGFALTYLLVVYSVAISDRRWMLLLLGALVLQVGGVSLFHASPTQVATVQAAVALFVLLANELLFHPIVFTRPRLRRREAMR